MRKADYAALADILALEISTARRIGDTPALAAATRIAKEFAARASVDRSVFLKACGIDP